MLARERSSLRLQTVAHPAADCFREKNGINPASEARGALIRQMDETNYLFPPTSPRVVVLTYREIRKWAPDACCYPVFYIFF